MFTNCLEFTKAISEKNIKFSFHVETSEGFVFSFESQFPGTPGKKILRKSPSQLRRNQTRLETFLKKKREASKDDSEQPTGTPETEKASEEISDKKDFDENSENAI